MSKGQKFIAIATVTVMALLITVLTDRTSLFFTILVPIVIVFSLVIHFSKPRGGANNE